MREIIKTDGAPAAIGPYSQGIKVGNLVFTAGQIALNEEGKLVSNNFEEQVRQVLRNLDVILKSAGSSLQRAVKLTVFLKDLNQFSRLNEVFKEFFSGEFPARSAVEVSRLPLDVQVEIEAIGVTD